MQTLTAYINSSFLIYNHHNLSNRKKNIKEESCNKEKAIFAPSESHRIPICISSSQLINLSPYPDYQNPQMLTCRYSYYLNTQNVRSQFRKLKDVALFIHKQSNWNLFIHGLALGLHVSIRIKVLRFEDLKLVCQLDPTLLRGPTIHWENPRGTRLPGPRRFCCRHCDLVTDGRGFSATTSSDYT
jgi:hypothetical protein